MCPKCVYSYGGVRFFHWHSLNQFLTRIQRRNFKRRMDKRLGLESHMDRNLWALCDKAKRKDVLSLEVCNAIAKFWINNTQINPNMKDIVRR
jgi:hypothetical protein